MGSFPKYGSPKTGNRVQQYFNVSSPCYFPTIWGNKNPYTVLEKLYLSKDSTKIYVNNRLYLSLAALSWSSHLRAFGLKCWEYKGIPQNQNLHPYPSSCNDRLVSLLARYFLWVVAGWWSVVSLYKYGVGGVLGRGVMGIGDCRYTHYNSVAWEREHPSEWAIGL